MGTIIVGNNIDGSCLSLWVLLIQVLLSVHVGLSLGGSEDEFSEACNFVTLHNSGNSLDVDEFVVDQWLLVHVVIVAVLQITLDVLVKLRDHFLGNFEHLVAVLDVSERGFTFL